MIEANDLDSLQIPNPALAGDIIKGYRTYRSPTNNRLMNVIAVGEKEQPLFVRAVDLTLDEAQEMTDMLNLEFNMQPGVN